MNKIEAITKGSQIIDQIFREIVVILKSESGLTESGLVQFIKRRGKELGASSEAFPSIVAWGKNSSEIHHFAAKSLTKIGRNNFLMFDFGVKVDGYCSDFTRTVFLGKPTKDQERIYNLVLKAQLAGIKAVRAGHSGDEIDFASRHIINQSGLGKFFMHGNGHGVGRQIHEAPSFKTNSGDVVKSGDIVTIEPGLYFQNKFGIRIEDMVFVTDKPKVLSQIPKDFRSIIIPK